MKKRILTLCIVLLCLIPLAAHAAQSVPYRVQIDWEGTPVFNGAGYDYKHVGDVGEAGIYTIVQEVWDIEGYVWGQLKSGAGWVNLTDITGETVKTVPYIQRVPNKDQPIYGSAGYQHKQVGTVEKAANYTIVEEVRDADGNLWGRLKSGAGWIDLSDVLVNEWEFIPYLVYISDPDLPVYAGADSRDDLVGTVEKAAYYTIVAEHWDDYGNLWGKLKSGKGWINLTADIATPSEPTHFLQYVRRADQPVFGAPSYDSIYAGTVRESGTYTIIAEARDSEGNLWGQLKSGAGWIDLTDVWMDETSPSPVSAGYADENLLLHADYEEYIGQDSEIATYVAFRVYKDVSDIALTSLVWDTEGYEVDRILHTIPKLEVGRPFVAALPFYGDMTAYGLSLTDSVGQEHFYAVTISMRNGMLQMNEYTP